MTGEAVLIAAFSARALAESARRAGYAPLVADCFGDLDTSEAAEAMCCLPARVQTGFRTRPLIGALESLAGASPRPPVGLVLGSGFECSPRLVAKLAGRFRLIGNAPEVIARTKAPGTFFATLDRLGIRHPPTRTRAPDPTDGWLMKRIGGSGGLHVVDCPTAPRPDPRRYFQERIGGEEVSVLGVIARRGSAFAFSRQWVSPLPRRPYRYGGAAGPLTPDPDLEARLIDTCHALARELGLVGLVSFDFLVADGEPSLLEVNPRPGAALEVLDDASGSLFAAHMAACDGGDPAALLKAQWRPPAARAAGYLYADAGPLTVPEMSWPPWAADRPKAGTAVAQHQPLATATAEASDLDVAEVTCRERLGLLAKMLYQVRNGKGAPR